LNHKTQERHETGNQYSYLSHFFGPSWFTTLLEPTGLSLRLTDEDGEEAGYILYDAFGGVLDSDFEADDLETALGSTGELPDPATGLVHLGNGRCDWFE
jgi:hypothetical protein